MNLTFDQADIAAAQALLDAGDVHGAWEILGNSGDNYARNAAKITDPDSTAFAQKLVKNVWEITVGRDVYNDKFGDVAASHLQNYLDIIADLNLQYPDTNDIEDSYRLALQNNGVSTDAAVDFILNEITNGVGFGGPYWPDALNAIDAIDGNEFEAINPTRISNSTDNSTSLGVLNALLLALRAGIESTIEEIAEAHINVAKAIIQFLNEFWNDPEVALNSAFDYLIELFDDLVRLIDPLTIDLDGDGVNTTSVEGSEVRFDLDNNGVAEIVGWVEPEDGLIAHDWKGNLDGGGKPVGNGEIQDRSELFATFDELSRHDINKDGILDASDVAPPPETDVNGDGSIDEDDIVQPTVTGDFDGDGTLETINVGWDQLQVWVDANSDGQTDAGELRSLESLGIASIDLDATPLEVPNNGNIINSESSVSYADGSSSVVNGVSFNRNTLNQSYEQQINALDLSPERLADRLDVFTMPQMQGVGNVPHLMIAALGDDDVLNAWRAVSDYDGGNLTEFRGLVNDLLIVWSGGDELAREARGVVTPSLLNAIEEFLGTEYPEPNSTLDNYEQTTAVIGAWNGFVDAVAMRFIMQHDHFDTPGIAYDFTTDGFSGSWNQFLEYLEAQYTDPDLTIADKGSLTGLFLAITSTVTAIGDNTDYQAAEAIEEILSKINVVNPIADFYENFHIGYTDDPEPKIQIDSIVIDRILDTGGGGVSETFDPPGYVFDPPSRSTNSGNATFDDSYANTNNSVQKYIEAGNGDPERQTDRTNDALLLGGRGNDIFDVRAAFEQNNAQTMVYNNNFDGHSTLFVGNAEFLEFTRDENNLFVTNTQTGSTVVVKDQFSTSIGVTYILFGTWDDASVVAMNKLLTPESFPGFEQSSWNAQQIVDNSRYKGTDRSDFIQGTSTTGDLGKEFYIGGLGDDIIVGQRGADTYIYHAGDGNDTIVDNGNGGSTDVLEPYFI